LLVSQPPDSAHLISIQRDRREAVFFCAHFGCVGHIATARAFIIWHGPAVRRSAAAAKTAALGTQETNNLHG
jgi:hypothetical protein